jgi:acyl-CoA synthetase (AMP-forming)/AMP-acid ligase II
VEVAISDGEGGVAAPRRDRRDHGARRAGDARLLEERGGTAKTIVDGWLMTGDVGRLDADGYLTLADRSKDVIISGGTNIYPREVEEVLLTHPDVHEVSVVGRPSAEWGEDVVAFVVAAPGRTVDEPRWTPIAWTRWRGSSGPRTISRCPTCPRTTTARC